MKSVEFARFLGVVGLAVAMVSPATFGQGTPPSQPPAPAPATPQPVDPQPANPNQPSRPTRKPRNINPAVPTAPAAPQPTTPTQPGMVEAGPITEPGPFITRTTPKDWTFKARVDVRATEWMDENGMPRRQDMTFKTMQVVFPVVVATSGSKMELERVAEALEDTPVVSGELKIGDATISTKPELLKGFPAGLILAKWMAADGVCREVTLLVEQRMTCWRTEMDESKAMAVDWPKNAFPPVAMSTFRPQLFVEMGPNPESRGRVEVYDPQILQGQIKAWLAEAGVADPKSVPPVRLAKILAGKVQGAIQISGSGYSTGRNGKLEGIDLIGSVPALVSRRGSEFDLACLLCAVYRSAGLPARTVIGWDVGRKNDDLEFLTNKGQPRPRAWVEFYLYDEANRTANWIPVDIAEMRRVSSRPPGIDRAWRYFGTHDQLNGLLPFALQFHPPSSDVVSYGSPGFWGWNVDPYPPSGVFQVLDFVGLVSTRRASDPVRPDEDERKPQRRNRP